MTFRPKFISFDCYGTLIDFQIVEATTELFASRMSPEALPAFISDFSHFRFDEAMGDWKPYVDVIKTALERACKRHGLEFVEAEGQHFYDLVPTWGPHADVTAPLTRIAKEIPLVILSNASNAQIQTNVDKLIAPFHSVFTAEQAQAYKPRLRAFEYMIDQLGCAPSEILHVSSSLRYDLMSANDLGIVNKVFVNRGHGPGNPAFGYTQIEDIGGLPAVVGL